MFNTNKSMNKYLFAAGLLLLMNISSCGFAYVKHVTKKYYIIGVDTKEDLGLSYKLGSGDFIGKAPGQLIQYGYNDTILVAKTHEHNSSRPSYYIIDMTKDSELEHEEIFRIGPISEEDFTLIWKRRLQIELKNVK
jgi:hypothetical protein